MQRAIPWGKKVIPWGKKVIPWGVFDSIHRRFMNTSPFKTILVTDPSYVKTITDYDENILPDTCGDPNHKSPGSYVRLDLDRNVYESFRKIQQSARPSPESDEMLFVFGELHPLKNYKYLGSHHTDSGLTSIVKEGIYSEQEDLELDWLELVSRTLDSTRDGAIDVEEFPLLDFCGNVFEEESAVAVFGLPSGDGYSSLVLRAWCKAFPDDLEC
jgi:hypothetical protein